MTTVLFYHFILISSTFFVWLSEKGKRKIDRYFFLIIAFCLVFIPSSIRYDTGVDYLSYIRIYENINTLLGLNYITEPFFYFINVFVYSLDGSPQWVIAILAFLFTSAAFMSYPKKNGWVIHFIFFVMVYFESFNIIRQSVAISFSLLSIMYFLNGRIALFILFSLIGATFHISVVLITIAGLISLIPFKAIFKNYIFPFMMIIIILMIIIKPYIILLLIEKTLASVGLMEYAAYFDSRYANAPVLGSGLSFLAKALFSIYVIFFTKKIIQINSRYWFIIILLFLYIVFTLLFLQMSIFYRAAFIFYMVPALVCYFLYTSPVLKETNKIVLFSFITLVFLHFSIFSFGFKYENGTKDPKINPYITILDDNLIRK